MKRDCTTCIFEPDWEELPSSRNRKGQQGFCKFGPLPPVYPKQEATPIYKFSDNVGLPGACRAWVKKSKLIIEDEIQPTEHKLSDYDIWFKPCEKCGYDPGNSRSNRCWKCGRIVHRDYSDRALKINAKNKVSK